VPKAGGRPHLEALSQRRGGGHEAQSDKLDGDLLARPESQVQARSTRPVIQDKRPLDGQVRRIADPAVSCVAADLVAVLRDLREAGCEFHVFAGHRAQRSDPFREDARSHGGQRSCTLDGEADRCVQDKPQRSGFQAGHWLSLRLLVHRHVPKNDLAAPPGNHTCELQLVCPRGRRECGVNTQDVAARRPGRSGEVVADKGCPGLAALPRGGDARAAIECRHHAEGRIHRVGIAARHVERLLE
jgi:hypothetical protein